MDKTRCVSGDVHIDRIGKVLFGSEVESLNCPGTIGGESSSLPPRSGPKRATRLCMNTRVKYDLIFRECGSNFCRRQIAIWSLPVAFIRRPPLYNWRRDVEELITCVIKPVLEFA
jgi:hypothetical protein